MTKNNQWVLEVACPNPKAPPKFNTMYSYYPDGTIECGNDPHKFRVFETFEEADELARYINEEFGYFVGVKPHE